MNLRHFLAVAALGLASVAHAEAVNLYVADDFHPIEDVADMAVNAASVLDGQRMVLVKDGQVARLSSQAASVAAAQAQNIHFFVCDTDLAVYKNAAIPSGVAVVHTSRDGETPSPHTTFDKRLQKLCSE